jgi:hypothetical protein
VYFIVVENIYQEQLKKSFNNNDRSHCLTQSLILLLEVIPCRASLGVDLQEIQQWQGLLLLLEMIACRKSMGSRGYEIVKRDLIYMAAAILCTALVQVWRSRNWLINEQWSK